MRIEKIESYPPLTIDEQETVLTWDAKERAWHIYVLTTRHTHASMKQRLMSPRLSRKAIETER